MTLDDQIDAATDIALELLQKGDPSAAVATFRGICAENPLSSWITEHPLTFGYLAVSADNPDKFRAAMQSFKTLQLREHIDRVRPGM